MAIILDNGDETRDRRMKMLLDTATTAMQIQNQKQQLSQQAMQNQAENQYRTQQLSQDAQKIALSDPAQNKFLRAEQATQNRLRMAQSKRYETGGGMGTPRFMQDEDGNLVQLPGILVETPQQKMDRKVAAPTADQKNALQSNQNAMFVFDELKKLSSGLEEFGGYEGLAITGGNVVTRGKLNPQAQAYADFMPAAAVNLYRGITGDTRLSDYDAQRAYGMVWNIGQDGEIKGIKEGAVENLLRARNILLSNNIYATKAGEKITSLDDVSFVSNAVSQGVSEDEILKFLKSKRKK